MTTPIYLAPLDTSHIPHKYELLIHSQRCESCGSVHQWSEVHGVTLLRGRMGQGLCDNKRPADHMKQIQYNLPIEIKRRNTIVPLCHACYRPQMLQHLPTAPIPTKVIPPSWVGTGDGSKQSHWQDKKGSWHEPDVEEYATTGTVKVVKRTKAPQRKYTIDDL